MVRSAGLALAIALTLCGCASLLDFQYVGKDGKESPYKVTPDKYEPPRDPTTQFQ